MCIFHSILVLSKADAVRFSSLKKRLRSRRLTCFLPRVPEHNSNVALTRGSMSHDSGHLCLTTLGEALKSTYTNVLPCPVILLPRSLSLITPFFSLPQRGNVKMSPCSTQLLILNLSRRPHQVLSHPCAFPSSSKAHAITVSSKVTAAFTSSAHLARRCTARPNTSGLHHLPTASLGCTHLQRDVLESCRLPQQSLPL